MLYTMNCYYCEKYNSICWFSVREIVISVNFKQELKLVNKNKNVTHKDITLITSISYKNATHKDVTLITSKYFAMMYTNTSNVWLVNG